MAYLALGISQARWGRKEIPDFSKRASRSGDKKIHSREFIYPPPPMINPPLSFFGDFLKIIKPLDFFARSAKIFGHFVLLKGISLLNSASFENNKTHPPLFQIPKLKKENPHSKISRIWTLRGGVYY